MSRSLPVLQPPYGCSLDSSALAAQAGRAAVLGRQAERVHRGPGSLVVAFADVDGALVDELVETERACCSFLELEWDGRERVLTPTSADPRGAAVLDLLQRAFEGGRA